MQDDTAKFVKAAGGKVLGSVAYPFPNTTDFSSFLIQAQSSGANVIAFTSSGADLANCMKQAQEFGLTQMGLRLAAMIGYVTDVQAMGLPVAQGLTLTETFYWDLNDRTRAFMNRIRPKLPANVFPNMSHVGNYSGVLDYLKAVKQMGVARAKASGRAVMEAMRAMPTDDDCFGPGAIRVDGRVIHPAYLFQVKTPSESKSVRATCTSCSPPRRPMRRSGRSTKAAVRWSARDDAKEARHMHDKSIIDLRTYTIRPRGMPEFLDVFDRLAMPVLLRCLGAPLGFYTSLVGR